MSTDPHLLGMLLKGYPRISESFISSEILLLEQLGIAIEIYSLKQPRESFAHRNVKQIRADVTYLPEYVIPNLWTLARSNTRLAVRLGRHYFACLGRALSRSWQRNTTATLRHFLQAGHLCRVRLLDRPIEHLHAHFCHTPTSVALFASELIGIPFSFTAHAKDIYTSRPDQLRRKLAQAAFVVTCTRFNAHYLSQFTNGSTPIHVIYHGIDPSFFTFEAAQLSTPPYQILSVGRLVAKKGYDDLLVALKMLQDADLDFQFTHIGSGEQAQEIRDFAGTLGLENRVRFLGTLPHHEVLHYYRASHCFVLASKIAPNGDRDGIPNVLIEAMATGLPVLSTRVSAIPELVEDGVTGSLVEPSDPVQLAAALTRMLQHPARCHAMLPQARHKVEQSFDNRKCIHQLHELFNRVLRSPQATRPKP